ncbi:hypothetical protein GSI_13329 [Ganoderma sinense ZZ0214-1]|uniref:Uncharacterized protein n=1 Tax=Ganoderma sinense ZZ0214-1 TaxID=1077348 RepID=A0A2G8RVB6_9APHY|nr:hypothetical protein GSI_13329 [Ganoderma sinense ZZ0214-1]
MKERVPATVKECRRSLSILHRRGLLRVAVAALGEKKDEAWVCVWPEEGAPAASSYTRQYDVRELLYAVVNVLDKTPS